MAGSGPQHVTCQTGHPQVTLGPDGSPVIDQFSFVHQPLAPDGSITVRVSSLTGQYPNGVVPAGNPSAGVVGAVQQWAKVGVIVKENLTPGSPYAAVMVTGNHGVRMQYDYTHDLAGMPGTVSPSSPRWLRLTRSGDTLTGYDSTDGRHWTEIGSAHLTGLPATVQAGMFAAASADYTYASPRSPATAARAWRPASSTTSASGRTAGQCLARQSGRQARPRPRPTARPYRVSPGPRQLHGYWLRRHRAQRRR